LSFVVNATSMLLFQVHQLKKQKYLDPNHFDAVIVVVRKCVYVHAFFEGFRNEVKTLFNWSNHSRGILEKQDSTN
jgi:hypothetical protein